MHWSSCLQPKVQLGEFLINTFRLITINTSLLVFPMEFPSKRETLDFYNVVIMRVTSSTGHTPAALPLPGFEAGQSTPSAPLGVSAAPSAFVPCLQPPETWKPQSCG